MLRVKDNKDLGILLDKLKELKEIDSIDVNARFCLAGVSGNVSLVDEPKPEEIAESLEPQLFYKGSFNITNRSQTISGNRTYEITRIGEEGISTQIVYDNKIFWRLVTQEQNPRIRDGALGNLPYLALTMKNGFPYGEARIYPVPERG